MLNLWWGWCMCHCWTRDLLASNTNVYGSKCPHRDNSEVKGTPLDFDYSVQNVKLLQVVHLCHYCAMYSMCWRSSWMRERRRYFAIKTQPQWLTHDVRIITGAWEVLRVLYKLLTSSSRWTETDRWNQMKMCKMYICICGKCKYVKMKTNLP